VWLFHLLAGVPAAALAHSVVQFAYAWDNTASDAVFFPVHFLLGLGCGLPILVPAHTLQAGLFFLLARLRAPAGAQVVAGGLLQAGLVLLWAAFVGVQPSLGGNFPMTPVMVAAAALVGGLVAALASRRRWAA